ncbi:MAG: hypothetical protein IT158_22865 [Bryobacterales bacterium]|nr:hypothetical protein [Bryobacterales bacterium]
MSRLEEAIARYHRILESDPFRDLEWAKQLRERMEADHLSSGGRLLCPFLRPHLLTRRQYNTLVSNAEHLVSAIDRMQNMVLASPALMARMDLLPAEKMLASIDPGYRVPDVTSQIDSHVNNGTLHLVQYNADSPTGVAWAEHLAELFYDCGPVKEFRKKHRLTRVGGKKHMLAALLKAYKEFGGKDRPRIGILELRSSFHGTAPSEYELFRDFFRREGYEAEIVSPDQLEYRNGVLVRGGFRINLIYRRISVQEFLMRFDLSHPLVRAYRDRAVCVVNGFRSELAHKKVTLGLLTDETLTARFPAAERKAIREHVPWTRLVAATKTTYADQVVDLPDFILQNRERFVLKPNDDYAGKGIFFGSEMDSSGWERALRVAMRTPYVVQERVDFAKALFPLSHWGDLEYREMRVDVHPHAYLGKVMGCSSWLTATGSGGFSTTAGLAPTFILESGG